MGCEALIFGVDNKNHTYIIKLYWILFSSDTDVMRDATTQFFSVNGNVVLSFIKMKCR